MLFHCLLLSMLMLLPSMAIRVLACCPIGLDGASSGGAPSCWGPAVISPGNSLSAETVVGDSILAAARGVLVNVKITNLKNVAAGTSATDMISNNKTRVYWDVTHDALPKLYPSIIGQLSGNTTDVCVDHSEVISNEVLRSTSRDDPSRASHLVLRVWCVWSAPDGEVCRNLQFNVFANPPSPPPEAPASKKSALIVIAVVAVLTLIIIMGITVVITRFIRRSNRLQKRKRESEVVLQERQQLRQAGGGLHGSGAVAHPGGDGAGRSSSRSMQAFAHHMEAPPPPGGGLEMTQMSPAKPPAGEEGDANSPPRYRRESPAADGAVVSAVPIGVPEEQLPQQPPPPPGAGW